MAAEHGHVGRCAFVALALFLVSATAAAAVVWATAKPRDGVIGVAAERDSDGSAESEGPDWKHPFADGKSVANATVAADKVPFKLVAPASLGTPRAVYVHSSGVPRDQQGVAAVYESPRYGEFQLLELPSTWSATDLQRPVDDCASGRATCEGEFRLTKLTDGTRALEITGAPSTVLIFVHGNVKYQVQGPDDTLSAADAHAIADAVERAR